MPPRATKRRASARLSSNEAAPPPPVRKQWGAVTLDVDDAEKHVAEIKNVAMVRAIYSEARNQKNKAGFQKLDLKQAFQLVKDGSRAVVMSKGLASLIQLARTRKQQEDTTADFEEEVEEIKRAMDAGEHFDDMKNSLISIVTKAFGAEDAGVALQFKDAMLQVSDSLSSLQDKLSTAKKDSEEVWAFLASIQDSFGAIGVNVQKLIEDVHKANVALGRAPESPKPKQTGTPTPEDSNASDSASSSDAADAFGEEEAVDEDDEDPEQVTHEFQEQVIAADIDDLIEVMANRWRTARRKFRMATMLKVTGKKPELFEMVAASNAVVAPMVEEGRPLTDPPFRNAPPAGWTKGHIRRQFGSVAERQIGIFAQPTSPRIARWTEVKKQAVSARGARGIESVMVDRSQRKGLIRGLGLRPLGVQRPPFPTTQVWDAQAQEDSTLLKVLSRHASRFEHDGIQVMANNAGKSSLEELTAYSLSHSSLSHLDVPARQRWAKLPQLRSRPATALNPDDLDRER
eukprot:TRINITY_DN5043_c0_g1_i1.p1 TRINITY_DN5043_c0_g1~~TRINITY_DN5043_c0_g1_i1.p1  ORF type:complete len:515 (-),score=113.87 TRINITY_DN5043_c0_g1_i1:303-1847(-)